MITCFFFKKTKATFGVNVFQAENPFDHGICGSFPQPEVKWGRSHPKVGVDSMALCKCKTRKIAGFCNSNNMHIMCAYIYIHICRL